MIRERLTVSKDAALLLKSMLAMRAVPEDGLPLDSCWKRMSPLNLELPLLHSDNETDLQEFGNTDVPSFSNIRLPLETVDDEKDEGLGWPAAYLEYPKIHDAECQAEKLAVSRGVLLFLQKVIHDDWGQTDIVDLVHGGQSGKRLGVQLLTPPLLPISPPLTPYIPSSPGNRLELLSDSSNSPLAELKVLEDRIMKDDTLLPGLDHEASDDSMLLDEVSSLREVQEKPVMLSMKRKARDCKVEGPLTPLNSDSPSKKLKSVSFKEMVCEYIPDITIALDSGSGSSEALGSVDDVYRQLESHAKEATRRLESEKLSEVDTTKRVDVPHIDSISIVAPWDVFSRKVMSRTMTSDATELQAQKRFLTQVKRSDLGATPTWHGISKLDRELSWAVFRKEMGSIALEENLHGGELVDKLLTELTGGNIATSSTDIWHRDGLRILEDDNSVEELDPADYGATAIGNREVGLGHQSADVENLRQKTFLDGDPGQKSESSKKISRQGSLAEKPDDNTLMFGGKFSTSTALQRFMEIHGKARESQSAMQQTSAPGVTPTAPDPSSRNPCGREVTKLVSPEPQHAGASRNRSHQEPKLPLKLPEIPKHLPACSYIMSFTLLRQRNLSREIKALYPSAHIIERDFTLPHSPSDEADLLLSPSTGLICTTLQQIKQTALPGQPDRAFVKERLSTLAARYERLIVLISEGLSVEAESYGRGSLHAVDARDRDAMAQFGNFASKMDVEVFTVFVRGGEQALARAIVNEMVKWGLPHGFKDLGDLRLLEDETTWEVFLRRAGLNPFSAQIILASFKHPYDMPLRAGSPYSAGESQEVLKVYGLPAFLLLEPEERITRFEVLMGGRRVLSRINEMLERKWPSAANGFKI
ncbi:uncharacterized protein EI97DRAFT_431268, partial [Westerdykella ornata]